MTSRGIWSNSPSRQSGGKTGTGGTGGTKPANSPREMMENARASWAEMTGEDPPKKKPAGSLRLKRVKYPKDDASNLSAHEELEQMGFEIPKHISIKNSGDLGYFEAALKPLVLRGADSRIRMALIQMIEIRGFERTEDLINRSELRSELKELVPDLFR